MKKISLIISVCLISCCLAAEGCAAPAPALQPIPVVLLTKAPVPALAPLSSLSAQAIIAKTDAAKAADVRESYTSATSKFLATLRAQLSAKKTALGSASATSTSTASIDGTTTKQINQTAINTATNLINGQKNNVTGVNLTIDGSKNNVLGLNS